LIAFRRASAKPVLVQPAFFIGAIRLRFADERPEIAVHQDPFPTEFLWARCGATTNKKPAKPGFAG